MKQSTERQVGRPALSGLLISFVLLAGTVASAETGRDLTGYWQLTPESQRPLPRPELTAWAREQGASIAQLTQEIERWCLFSGMPAQMRGPAPVSILQGRTEVLLLSEGRGSARHIYTTVGAHPDPEVHDLTTVGHSIGRWEGDSLVVDTMGFSEGPGPAGAPRTESTRLAERFRLAAPDRLVVNSTWTDPKVYARPYAYSQTFTRVPAGYNARESYCDPRDRAPEGLE